MLLGIKAAEREDLKRTSAELVYGKHLPLIEKTSESTEPAVLRGHFRQLRPAEVKPFIFLIEAFHNENQGKRSCSIYLSFETSQRH